MRRVGVRAVRVESVFVRGIRLEAVECLVEPREIEDLPFSGSS